MMDHDENQGDISVNESNEGEMRGQEEEEEEEGGMEN